jgi:predicted nucleic acid-binding protein
MLLDTSGLLALLDAREPLHQEACSEYRRATIRITHGFILAELVALGNTRGVPLDKILQFLMSLLANPDIRTIWPDQSLTSQAISLLFARQGRGYSLCDAVSFVVMRSNSLSKALTTDKHFDDEGFQRLLILSK